MIFFRINTTLLFVFLTAAMLGCGEAKQKKMAKVDGDTQSDTLHKAKDTILNASIADTAIYTSLTWIDSTYKDIGKIKRGKSVPVSFRFKNTGNKPLVIRGIHVACGCTVPDTLNPPVLPGKTGTIKVKLFTNYLAIATNVKQVFVDANTKPHNGHILVIKAEVTE